MLDLIKKKVLIDATTIKNSKDGLSQYIIGLVNNLPEASFNLFEYIILINPGIEREELLPALQSGKFKVLIKNIRPIGPKREWDMFWFLLKNKNKFDLFHSTSNQFPLFLKKGVATIHDIIFTQYLDSSWWTFNFAKRYLNFVVKNSLHKSASVIAVSAATKNELTKHYNLTGEITNKIKIIYEGWEHLLPTSTNKEVLPSDLAYKPYLFYVGSSRKHKNLAGLVRGFIIALDKLPKNIRLVISGDFQYVDNSIKNLINTVNRIEQKIVFTGFVSNNLLNTIFKNADAFIFPSFYEGFGIPVLESFYFKKPLLCSNTTSLPEVAGDAALYFDPSDPNDIARVMVFFYDNPDVWNVLIEKGQERLKLFSWKKTAEETVDVYKQILIK